MTGPKIMPDRDQIAATPLSRFDPLASSVIDRCSRGGRVAWQHVANMLGRNEHSVRCDYDPTYLRNPSSENPA